MCTADDTKTNSTHAHTNTHTCTHRGVVSLEIEVVTASADVHSGRYGGSIPNAAVVLSKIVAQLHKEDTGVIAVPGFYKVVGILPEMYGTLAWRCGLQCLADSNVRSLPEM